MSARVDINDRESLKAWLEDQPREVVLFISTRAALRLIPVVWYWAGFDKSGRFDIGSKLSFDELLLEYLHAALITHIGCAPKDISSPPQISAMKIAMIDPAPNSVLMAHDAAAISCRLFEQHDPISDASRTLAACSQSLQQLGDVLPDSPGNPYLKNLEETDAVSEWVNDHDNWSVREGTHDLRLWHAHNPLTPLWDVVRRGTPHTGPTDDIFSTAPSEWQFWIDWYESLLDGRPMLGDAGRTWEMLEQIALIDSDIWDKGPEVVNPVIREIWEGYLEYGSHSGSSTDPEPVSEDARSAMNQRVAVNRDALAVAGAGLLDQLAAFRDRVRGMNHLDSDTRAEVLAFIDEFSGKLTGLLEGLPPPGTSLDDDQAGRLVLWLREYRGLLRHKLAYYGSAENMAEATVPTGIILGATGIGAMLGMPVAGSVVGGLIVNQMKPGQAAKELTERTGKDGDAG